MEISTGYHFTAIREEIRKHGDRESKRDGARGKGPSDGHLGKGEAQEPRWQRLEGRTLRESKCKYREISATGPRNHTPETTCKEKP